MSIHTAVCRCGNTFVREDTFSLRCDICQLLDRCIDKDDASLVWQEWEMMSSKERERMIQKELDRVKTQI